MSAAAAAAVRFRAAAVRVWPNIRLVAPKLDAPTPLCLYPVAVGTTGVPV